MVPIKQNLVAASKYNIKCPYSMTVKGITVHNTANNASAQNEIAYMIRNNNETSYHYAVDDVEIVQGILDNRNGWHASDGNGNGNRTTLGIEICYSTGDKAKFEKAQENAAELVAYKLKEYNLTIDKVYTHKHWCGKHCPHRTLDEYGWDYFIGLVNKYLNGGSSTTTKTTTSKIDITYQIWDDVKNTWLPNVVGDSDYAGIYGHDVCCVYANLAVGDCVYKVHTQGGKWLPEVKNRTDYAGIFNKPIDGFMIKATDPNVKIYYQVHIRGGNWLPYVTGYSTSDSNNGYAGILGKPIDGIRMYAVKTTTTTVVTPKPTPIVTPTEPEVEKIYRVRKSWKDSKSQKGAYKNLDSAKNCCQKAGEGYKVFDWNGKEVYSYITPKPVEPTPTPVEPIPTPVEPPVESPIEPSVEPVPTPIEPTPKPIEPENPTTGNDEVEPEPTTTEPIEPEENKTFDIIQIIIKIINFIVSLFKKN